MNSLKIYAQEYTEKVLQQLQISTNNPIQLNQKTIEITNCHNLFDISEQLTNFILQQIEPQIISEEVEIECLSLLEDEIEFDIIERVKKMMLQEQEQRSIELNNEILSLLQENGKFHLEGFINFRLLDRRLQIKEFINIALEDFFNDENDEQFVEMIKKIVVLQQEQMGTLHLVFLDENKYEFFDNNFQLVEMEEVREALKDMTHNDEDLEEQLNLILSILMTLIPKNIVVHTKQEQNEYLSKMLLKIYDDKIDICFSCDDCNSLKNNYNQEKLNS